MRVLVVGAGAIGAFVGGRLRVGGHEVALIGRRGFVEEARRTGIHIEEGANRVVARDVAAFEQIVEACPAFAPVDLIIVAVKSYDTAAVADELRACPELGGVPVLTLQNGVGNEELLGQRLGAERVVAGVITSSVTMEGPARLKVARSGLIGVAPVRSERACETALKILSDAGIPVVQYAEYRGLKWSKLLMNLTANASSAILGWEPARIFAHPEIGRLEVSAWKEALAVMRALGVRPVTVGSYRWPLYAVLMRLLPEGWIRVGALRMASRGRGEKMPSLHLDLHRGRARSEVGWLNRAVVRYGEQRSVPVPVNRALTEVLMALVERRLPLERALDRPDRLMAAVEEARAGRDPLAAYG